MQFTELNDAETKQLLQKIEKRLAMAYPSFDELDREVQEQLFLNALDRTPLSEVFEIATTDPDLVAGQRRKEMQEQQAMIERARAAGFEVET